MHVTSVQNINKKSCKRHLALSFPGVLLIFSLLMLTGCLHVPVQEQRLVSKPNMQFSGSEIFTYQDKLLTQFESGSASSTGGQSGDCGSCVGGSGQ